MRSDFWAPQTSSVTTVSFFTYIEFLSISFFPNALLHLDSMLINYDISL